MESAIAPHLKCPRSRTRRIPDDYVPAFPIWVARTEAGLKQIVMGYFGVQSKGADQKARGFEAFRKVVDQFNGTEAPRHRDFVHVVDADGYDNWIAVAYWDDPQTFERWLNLDSVSSWWQSADRLTDGVGYFREIVSPRMEQFETAYSTPTHLEGVGCVMGRMSGEVQEHGYWGAMRDRIPLSQTEFMSPSGSLSVATGRPAEGRRVKILGHDNLTLIRSGQDWSETLGEERRVYLDDMEPSLRAGMTFLRDHGLDIGCYSNRYVQVIDDEGREVSKSFGLSHWRSLAELERWAESHPTHLDIFMTFIRVVPQLQNLRLYHEVSVFDAASQSYEYVNCHARTGLMKPLAGS